MFERLDDVEMHEADLAVLDVVEQLVDADAILIDGLKVRVWFDRWTSVRGSPEDLVLSVRRTGGGTALVGVDGGLAR